MKLLVSVLLSAGLLIAMWLAFGAREPKNGIAPARVEPERARPGSELSGGPTTDGSRAPAVEPAQAVVVEAPAVAGDSATLPDEPEGHPPGLRAPDFGVHFYGSPDKKFSVRAREGNDASSLRIVSYHVVVTGHPEKSSEILPTDFWPTNIAKLSEGNLAVGGMVPKNGHSVIEIWRFDPPRESTDAPGGWVPAKRRTVERIYDERSRGRHVVRSMMPLSGGPVEALLVGFQNSADEYSIDVWRRCRLAASSQSMPGVVHAPFLGRVSSLGAAELVNGGYVYKFTDSAADIGAQTSYWLEDTNRDGVIDRARILTPKELAEQGYDRADAWVFH